MKIFFFIILFLFQNILLTANSDQGIKQRGKLIVRFDGIKTNEGKIKIALCNSFENYKMDDKPFIGKDIIVTQKYITVEFLDLPFGEYAVKAFHDEDADDDLDTNFLGIPTEDYGFSNNARGTFGQPSWKDAKFLFNTENQTMEIRLK